MFILYCDVSENGFPIELEVPSTVLSLVKEKANIPEVVNDNAEYGIDNDLAKFIIDASHFKIAPEKCKREWKIQCKKLYRFGPSLASIVQ